MSSEQINVAVYHPSGVPQSFKVYATNVMKHLTKFGVNAIKFDSIETIPKASDVIWDIRSGGGNAPPDFLLSETLPPLVVTVHGFAPTSLPGREYFGNLRGTLLSGVYARRKRANWRFARNFVHTVIAVSEFTKQETIAFTGISAKQITVCHHGVDKNLFIPGIASQETPYFFHISNDEPRKNISRIISAFHRFKNNFPVKLILKVPETSANKYSEIDGVSVIARHIDIGELAQLYRGALGFVFPSLYEGFGMPILEAMASGCPVITSSSTACSEVAGSASLLVDPRDIESIKRAFLALYNDAKERQKLIDAGRARTSNFSWERSAACHAHVFYEAANRRWLE